MGEGKGKWRTRGEDCFRIRFKVREAPEQCSVEFFIVVASELRLYGNSGKPFRKQLLNPNKDFHMQRSQLCSQKVPQVTPKMVPKHIQNR